MISVAHVEKDNNLIGFISDADAIDQQLIDLRNADGQQIAESARRELNMPSPGVANQEMRHIDMSDNTLCRTIPAGGTGELLENGKSRYKPIMLITFDSLYE